MVTHENQQDFYVIVKKAKQGDRSNMDALARIAQPRLRAHFLRITLDIDLTADLTQETMLRMIKHLSRLQNIERFWPWLFTIASNITMDHYRKKKYRTVTRFSAMEEHNLENVLRDDSCKPEKPACRREACSMLNSAIDTLKQRHRDVLTMRCFEERSFAQISNTFGCTEVAARTTLSRAKKTIRKYLQTQGMNCL